jgi:hypothetical protein
MNTNEFGTQGSGRGWKRGKGRGWWIKIPFMIAMIVAIKSVLVLWLWNELIPDLFHGPIITFWQACGLTILAKLLVSGGLKPFGMHHRGHFKEHFEKFCEKTPEKPE